MVMAREPRPFFEDWRRAVGCRGRDIRNECADEAAMSRQGAYDGCTRLCYGAYSPQACTGCGQGLTLVPISAQIELFVSAKLVTRVCVPKVLKLSSEVDECKPLGAGKGSAACAACWTTRYRTPAHSASSAAPAPTRKSRDVNLPSPPTRVPAHCCAWSPSSSTSSFWWGNRPVSVYCFPRRALMLCSQLCMGISPRLYTEVGPCRSTVSTADLNARIASAISA